MFLYLVDMYLPTKNESDLSSPSGDTAHQRVLRYEMF